MYRLMCNGKVIKEYRSRKEADYYKKQYPKSKVVTGYEVCDLAKDMFSENVKIEAESPMKALEEYIRQNNLNLQFEVDLSNTGRFVVRSHRTSKVYSVVA